MQDELASARRFFSANDEFKSRWNAYLSRSTVAAVLIHFGLMVWSPTWRPRAFEFEEPEVLYLEQPGWSVEAGPTSNPGPGPAVATPVEVEGDDGGALFDAERVANVDRLRQRLLAGGALRPTVVEEPEPEPEPESEENGGESEGGITPPDRDPTTADLSELLTLSPMDLERLSAVQPEIVLGAFSLWPLVRNPAEVAEFMSRAYATGMVDRNARGTVSVTVWIDERGSVGFAEISESSGRADVDELALALFNEVVAFRPARREGVPVPVSVVFWVNLPWF